MGFHFDGDFLWGDFGDFASELLVVVFVFCGCKNTSEVAGVELAHAPLEMVNNCGQSS